MHQSALAAARGPHRRRLRAAQAGDAESKKHEHRSQPADRGDHVRHEIHFSGRRSHGSPPNLGCVFLGALFISRHVFARTHLLQQTPAEGYPIADRRAFLSRNFAVPDSRPKPDRRTVRTEHSLHRALNTLVLEKGYRATTIHDIVTRANVGRSTFYAHHGSKEGLLLHGLHHLQEALLHQQSAAPGEPNPPVLGFSRVFFEHVHEYRDVFQALRTDTCEPVVTRKIKRLLTEVIRHDLRRARPEDRLNEIPRDAVVQFTANAFFSILIWWFECSPKLSPAEVDAIFRRLALPALAGVGLA